MNKGALLVRLETKSASIEALRSKGEAAKADLKESKQRQKNQNIVSAFKAHFTFCPTYFFFDNYSQNVMKKDFKSVQFLDENLEHDASIKFNGANFFTAEFGTLEQDTAQYFSGYYTVPTKNGPERRARYYGEPHMRFGALIIKSDQFVQLKRPFKYYSRTLDSVPLAKLESTVVAKMDKKLHRFYKRMMRRNY
ncbi:MAG: hypothetical protein AB8B53_06460 [Flavobacteriales bacterium]